MKMYIGMLTIIIGLFQLINAQEEQEVQHNYFYEDIKPDPTEYDLIDTFEGYIWHKFQHQDNNFKAFYLSKEAEKEFKQLRNISFDIDIIHIKGETWSQYKPKYPSS